MNPLIAAASVVAAGLAVGLAAINVVSLLGGLADGTHPLDVMYAKRRERMEYQVQPVEDRLNARLEDKSMQELEHICRILLDIFQDNHLVEQIYRGKSIEERSARREELRQLCSQQTCKDRNIVDVSQQDSGEDLCLLDLDYMQYFSSKQVLRRTATFTQLIISREGNFTCPIATGVIFLGQLVNQMQDLTSNQIHQKLQEVLQDDSCSMFDNMSKEPDARKFPIVARSQQNSGRWCEFASDWSIGQQQQVGRICTLRPAIWFHFFNLDEANEKHRQEARSREGLRSSITQLFSRQLSSPYSSDPKNLQGRDRLVIQPTQRWVGNVMVMKLINCENLMQLMGDDHPYPNIDIHKIQVEGSCVDLPEGVELV
eukprot:TRINITY_DN14376_c0_g1_i3.p1 TRINITY_DN14376_c0_g1~~TRINITY_DN14376_c0_g1_i3.p1  ORF type:complete len:378 (+),score=36.49 TRINITY_DN14376_c0_g1_i3:22-1134(+)